MSFRPTLVRRTLALAALLMATVLAAGETFRVATYNVENYLDEATQTRPTKPLAAKAKVRESILALRPDVLALEEMGSISALDELRASLKAGGLDFPFWEHVPGHDTNIHVAVLSKFPFTARRPHTNDHFLLDGRRQRVSRGFAELVVRVNTNYSFTLLAAHLKSRRPIPQADEAELRQAEARVLREKIDALLATNPSVNLVVLGDFNDTKEAKSTKEVMGRGKFKLVDTRPVERNGDHRLAPEGHELRNIAWTHYYAKEDLYSRLDYILLSPGMAREWVTNETFVLTIPDWGIGSDHRPVLATFEAEDK